jgi:outer membrane protein OmpA-like peptidoglycan-associated protein
MALTDQTPPGFEVLGGARLPLGPVELFVVGGPGFGSLPGTPAFRILGGVALKPEQAWCEAGNAHRPSDCPQLDDDGDGLLNGNDQCPLEREDFDDFEDEDGCFDADNDGDRIPDAEDRCPIEAGPKLNGGCLVREGDSDNDGTIDLEDQCPTKAGPKSRGGCPLQDTDADGIEDGRDNCPEVAGIASNQGCPADPKQVVAIRKNRLILSDKIVFALGKATVVSAAFPTLNQVALVLRAHPEFNLIIEGYSDDGGSMPNNQRLSLQRAHAVRAYLEHQGIDASRLTPKGLSGQRAAEGGTPELSRAKNQGIELILSTQ